MQQAIVRGDMIENDELIRLSSEVRRLLNALRHLWNVRGTYGMIEDYPWREDDARSSAAAAARVFEAQKLFRPFSDYAQGKC